MKDGHPVPTSAESMRKTLDRFGSSFQPTPQVAKKGVSLCIPNSKD